MSLLRAAVPISLLAVALFAGGCRTAGPPSAAALAGESAERLLILPLNVVLTLPNELEEPSGLVWQEIAEYAEAHGKQSQTVRLIDAHRLWLLSIRETKREGGRGFDTAARTLVQKLAEHARFAAVVVPSLFLTTAQLSIKSASWDGVTREVEVDGDPRHSGSIVLSSSLHGDIQAASLHVAVFDALGEKIHEGQGGLELVARIQVSGSDDDLPSERRVTFASRPHVLTNRAHLREGVRVALDPFLPPLVLAGE